MKLQGYEIGKPLEIKKENHVNRTCELLEWHRSGYEGDLELCGKPSAFIVKQGMFTRHLCKYHTKYIIREITK